MNPRTGTRPQLRFDREHDLWMQEILAPTEMGQELSVKGDSSVVTLDFPVRRRDHSLDKGQLVLDLRVVYETWPIGQIQADETAKGATRIDRPDRCGRPAGPLAG